MNTEIMKKLEKELTFVEDFIGLVETPSEKALDTQLAAMKVLTQRHKTIILLSTTRPYSNLLTLLKKNNIDTNNVLILDLVSQGQQETNQENVLFLNSAALTSISIEINKHITEKDFDKFIFLDSITTMLINNKPDVFLKFIHYLLTKMRINKVSGLLISFEKEENSVVEEIAQMCDKIIKI